MFNLKQIITSIADAGQKLFNKKEVESNLKIMFDKKTILVSYHSVTTISKIENIFQFKQVLDALRLYKKLNIIFTSPNIDPGNTDILTMIKKFIKQNKNAYFFKSLGQRLFFSVAKNSNIFIGNSSSGILEVPFLNIPVLNIGNRQKGRFQFVKIFNSNPKKEIIIKNINRILKEKINFLPFDSNLIKNASYIITKNIIRKLKNKECTYMNNKIFNDLKF